MLTRGVGPLLGDSLPKHIVVEIRREKLSEVFVNFVYIKNVVIKNDLKMT
jgi:hypothetical protein